MKKRKASDINNRRKREARYIIKHRCTSREAAKHFKLSKSTILRDINEHMPHISYSLYLEAREILVTNGEESLLRATLASAAKRRKKAM